MGLFDKLIKITKEIPTQEVLTAYAEGELISIKNVNDPTFAEEILGRGVAIKPSKGELYAPVDGTVVMLFDTLHAIALTTEMGQEILLHIGIDTVELKGKYFSANVKVGQKVKAGELMIRFENEIIQELGFDLVIPMIVTNKEKFSSFQLEDPHTVKIGEKVMVVSK
ncbi:MAG TPA: PTS glucose transporter subunit IIA [Lachnoclostridium sp.]|uniref:PTS sugar transporter subunit IIA n=1 Tax=Lacrimispora sp. TaxID=2719234 RepID=UPI000EBB2B0A|nr:PTS glucose transporter subunit IIA [Lacrimispora sp.]HCD42290.1 PTS glucose transporter subunit IIA [Lachnoclostridium sp.]